MTIRKNDLMECEKVLRNREKGKNLFLLGIILFLATFIFFLSSVSAYDYGKFKTSENLSLVWTCPNCSYVNFSLVSPEGNLILDNVVGSFSGSVYSYSINLQNYSLGIYNVLVSGDPYGVEKTSSYQFEVIRGGLLSFDFSSTLGIVLLVVYILIIIILLYVGLYSWAGLLLIVLFAFLLFNGVNFLISFLVLSFALIVLFAGGKKK